MNHQTDIYLALLRKFELETKEHEKTEGESARQLHYLTKCFLRPLAILRSFGNDPFSFTRVTYKKTDIFYWRFDHKSISWLTIYSVLCHISYIGGYLYLSTRLIRNEYQPSTIPGSLRRPLHNSKVANSLMRGFLSSFFLSAVVGAVSGFCNSSKLSKNLNKWIEFVEEFPKVFFGKSVNFELSNKLSKSWLMQNLIFSTIYIIALTTLYNKCIFNFENDCKWIEREQSLMFVGFGAASLLNTSFEQFKTLMILQTISHAFSKIADSVNAFQSKFSNGAISSLRNLFNLVYDLRARNQMIVEISGWPQLVNLAFLFYLSIVGWMLIIQFTRGDITFSLVVAVGSIGMIMTIRMGALAVLAEHILKEEKRVTGAVAEIRPRDVKAQIEIQIFLNALTKKPAAFSLRNIIAIRRSLFLALLSNSTTYLIAIMQFVELYNGDQHISPTSSSFGSNQTLDLNSVVYTFETEN